MNPHFTDLKGKVAAITGGAGVICSAIAMGLARAGVKTAILDLNTEAAESTAQQIEKNTGIPSVGVRADVLDKSAMETAYRQVVEKLGRVHFLVNGAGGNSPKATTAREEIGKELDLTGSFFDLDPAGFDQVFALNFRGTLIPTLVFARDMVQSGSGAILNISSMNSYRPLTKIPAYSGAKASINNFTQWLSVHLAKTGVRVNAIAPGFFLTNQNRFLLLDEKTGEPTPRGKKIISNTPMGRYGEVEELVGTSLFLLSDLSAFITGVIIPVDGGYSAFGGI